MRGVTAQDLRSRVVEEMRGDWASYEPFVDHALHPDYLANMARSTEYAGEPELVALSKVYGVTIRVWGADAAHDRELRAPSVGADAPVVHLAHRDARNFRDRYFAVQLPPRGDSEVHSQPIMQRMRGSFPHDSAKRLYRGCMQAEVGSVEAHRNAAYTIGSAAQTNNAPLSSSPRSMQPDVSAPSPVVGLNSPKAPQKSGNSLSLAFRRSQDLMLGRGD